MGCSRGFLLSPPVNHPKTCFLLPTGTRLELLLPVLPCVTHFGVLASSGGVCHICLTSCHPGNNKPPWKPAQFPPGTGLKELIVPLGSTAIPTGSARDLQESGLNRGMEINLQEFWHTGFHRLKSRISQIRSRTSHIKPRTSHIKGQDFTEKIQEFTDQTKDFTEKIQDFTY